MPGDAACQGLALAQLGIGDIAHVHGRHIAGSSAAQHLGTRGIWPPAMGHHQAARTSQRPSQAQRMLQPAAPPSRHWDGASCSCAPRARGCHAQWHCSTQHFSLRSPAPFPQSEVELCGARMTGQVGTACPEHCLWSRESPGNSGHSQGSHKGRQRGGSRGAPAQAALAPWAGKEAAAGRAQFPCGVCPAPAATFALPVLGLPSATAALPDSLPPSHSASWLSSNSLCPSPIFLLDTRSRLMHLETLQPFLVAVD